MTKHRLEYAEPRPEWFVAKYDNREQLPYNLAPPFGDMVTATLQTGDITLIGLEEFATIEVKRSIDELAANVGRDRDRFEREMMRIRAYPFRLLLIQGSREEIERGEYRGNVKPQTIIASLLGWQRDGIPVWFAKDRQQAEHDAASFLFLAARKRWREARALAGGIDMEPAPKLSRNAIKREALAAFQDQ